MTFLECGAYNESWHFVHMFPEETVKAHLDLKGRVLHPIHWGTFNLSLHPWYDPMQRLVTAAGQNHTDLQRHSFFASTLNHFFAQTIPMGVLPTLYAATEKDVQSGDFIGASGFMEMRGYPGKVTPTKRAKDPGPAETLWNLSEVLTGVKFGF